MAGRKRASDRSMFLSALLRTAYFPRELPPVVTAKHFSSFCRIDYKWITGRPKEVLNRWTKYDTFSAPTGAGGRRNLAIVHPVSQLALSLLITEHRRKISNIISNTNVSLYSTVENIKEFKAFDGLQFRKRNEKLVELCSNYDYILRADISKFFYTIYTHSIPWSIVGKKTTKDWLRNKDDRLRSHWSNKLDAAIQCCQDGETVGIPVGPDTSRIVSELVLAGIETEPDYLAVVGSQGRFRLLDDFAVGFGDEETAQRALKELRKALWTFNLQLNEEKTHIAQSTKMVDDAWRLEFRNIALSKRNVDSQKSDLYWLAEHSIKLCEDYEDSRPAIWGCRRLAQTVPMRDNLETLVILLLRFAKDYPACIPHVLEFFINNQRQCQDKTIKRRVTQWIRSTIEKNTDHSNDYEIAWSLVVAGVLRIEIGEDLMPATDRVPSPVIFAVLGMLRERRLLKVPLTNWPWRSHYKELGIYGHCWLPFYEAVNRGWTSDKVLIKAVNDDQLLKRCLGAKVTFLDDRIFDAKRFDFGHRVFNLRGTGAEYRGKSDRKPKTVGGQSRSFEYEVLEY